MKRKKRTLTKIVTALMAAVIAVTAVPAGTINAQAEVYKDKFSKEWEDSDMRNCAYVDSVSDTSVTVKVNKGLAELTNWNTSPDEIVIKPKKFYVEVYKGSKSYNSWTYKKRNPVKTVTGKNYKSVTVTGLEPDTKYTLVVRGCRTEDKKTVFTQDQDFIKVKTRKEGKNAAKPGEVKIKEVYMRQWNQEPKAYLSLEMEKTKKADGYQVRIYKDGMLLYNIRTNNNKMGTDAVFDTDTEYTVKIRAWQKTGKKTKYGKETVATVSAPRTTNYTLLP